MLEPFVAEKMVIPSSPPNANRSPETAMKEIGFMDARKPLTVHS